MDAPLRPRISKAFACAGVLLFVLAALFQSAGLLFAGIGCMAISEALTPCEDQITRWWRALLQASRRQN